MRFCSSASDSPPAWFGWAFSSLKGHHPCALGEPLGPFSSGAGPARRACCSARTSGGAPDGEALVAIHWSERASSAEARRETSGSTSRLQRRRAGSEKRPSPRPMPPRKPCATEKSRVPASIRFSCSCLFSTKGCRPPNMSMYIVTPAAQRSQRALYPRLCLGSLWISGDMKAGVPHFSVRSLPRGRKSARPKSASLRTSPATIKLSGLMSRWMYCNCVWM
mmetsp:Transcript_87593/g.228535  ORF Transcript_87593/g.228535 Transcript_87593/m.228535 type:complete len:221 (-) Transcript_87593:559-1221(-)